jgi:DNA-binding LacI/PurR family transcriptional regulator
VTLSAVARQANVSVATVSYVLNGVQLSRIPESTQLRVRDAARELGYVPNASARSLRVGKSQLVIAHLPGGTAMMQRAAAGIEVIGAHLREAGYSLLVHGDTTLRGLAAAKLWSGMRPAAVVTEPGLLDEPSIALLHQVGTVVIMLGQHSTATLPSLVLDDAMFGEVAARHLLERGCRRLVMLMPKHPRARALARSRLSGMRKVIREDKQRQVQLSLVNVSHDPSQLTQIVESWRKSGELPDGVYGFDDVYSGLLLGALLDAGVRVPRELALVGSDDQPLCEILRPRLTSIAQDLTGMRESFAEPLVAAIRGSWTQGFRLVPWAATLKPRDT